jgi:hypothetical protein
MRLLLVQLMDQSAEVEQLQRRTLRRRIPQCRPPQTRPARTGEATVLSGQRLDRGALALLLKALRTGINKPKIEAGRCLLVDQRADMPPNRV